MIDKLVFSSIEKENIFNDSFKDFTDNNIIEFSNKGVAVIYAPNGGGKTSLAKVLESEENTTFSVDCMGETYDTNNNTLFHVIADQNGRNIIEGETKDFVLGENIRKEFDLKKQINKDRDIVFSTLTSTLKDKFKVSKKTSKIIAKVDNAKLLSYISDLANRSTKGKNIKLSEFIDTIAALSEKDIGDYDLDSFNYVINDYDSTGISD